MKAYAFGLDQRDQLPSCMDAKQVNPFGLLAQILTVTVTRKALSRACCCLSGRNGNQILKPSNPMQNYIIIAQSILEEGSLGRIREVQTIASMEPTMALSVFQWETLRGSGDGDRDRPCQLHWEGLQFTALTQDEFFDAQGDEDELDGIEDFDCLEDALDAALDPIDERLARLKEAGQ